MREDLVAATAVPEEGLTRHLLKWRRRTMGMLALLGILVVAIILAASVGSASIPLAVVWQVMLSKLPFVSIAPTWPTSVETIVWDIRLPRIVLAAVVGGGLAVAGAAYQGLLRNPLADPYLIGVSQGAMLGAVTGLLLPLAAVGFSVVPLFAFAGALAAVALVYCLARVGKTVPTTTLILAGVALGAFLTSISYYLMITHADQLHITVSWLLGQFSVSRWEQVWVVLPYVVAGGGVMWLYARPLNVMQLDEEQAQQLGVNVERVKLVLLIAATLMTAAAVSFCGIIGFVGIIVPHAVRLIWGPDHRFLLPLSLVTGALFLVVADTLARTLLPPTEIPVGVVTALFGAPFFLYLLRKKKQAIW